jgi:DNA-binding protein HU-beta
VAHTAQVVCATLTFTLGGVMTKKELINRISETSTFMKKDVRSIVNAVFDVLASTLSSKENVVIRGFGRFDVVERAERKGFNPATKEKIEIPAHKSIRYKPYKNIVKNMNK